jgi:hypothetical protein
MLKVMGAYGRIELLSAVLDIRGESVYRCNNIFVGKQSGTGFLVVVPNIYADIVNIWAVSLEIAWRVVATTYIDDFGSAR